MQIELVSVSVEDKGKYSMALVAYRENGQLKEKKLMSFGGGAGAFKVLTKASQGQVYTITTVKNDKGYWDWTEATLGTAAPAQGGGQVATASPKSTYETAEERANRQVLIVRQSNISSAIEFLKLNPKKTPTTAEVLEVAKQFEAYVFGRKEESAGGLAELEDDVPL